MSQRTDKTVPTILTDIVAKKKETVQAAKASVSLNALEQQIRADQQPVVPFRQTLLQSIQAGCSAVIAEIKQASPSKGIIRDPFDPVAIAQSYQAHQATCLSVLTDEPFFKGSLSHLKAVKASVSLPILRKDFMIDPYQVVEARAAGASCILLIAAMLSTQQMQELNDCAAEQGLDVLIEVHNETELASALQVDQQLIGINNRNLHTFEVDLNTTLNLLKQMPETVTVVTESGIAQPADVAQMRAHDVHAFLVGEAFMRAPDPGEALSRLFATPTPSAV